MLFFGVVEMLKKRLGIEAFERDWIWSKGLVDCFKISSTLIISESVERIGDKAFFDCEKLRKVIIPGNVKSIGNYAFCDCMRLEEVEILEGVVKIEYSTFQDCKMLKKVSIPRSVDYIGYRAFEGCETAAIILRKPKNEFKDTGSLVFDVRYVKEETRT